MAERSDTTAEIASRWQKFKTTVIDSFRFKKTKEYSRFDLLDPLIRATIYDYINPIKTDKYFHGCRFLRREDRRVEKGGKLPFSLMKYAVAEGDLYQKLKEIDQEKAAKGAEDDPAKIELIESIQSEYLLTMALQFIAVKSIFRRLVLSQVNEDDRYWTILTEVKDLKKLKEEEKELHETVKHYLETRNKFLKLLEDLRKADGEEQDTKLSELGVSKEKFDNILSKKKELDKLTKHDEMLEDVMEKIPDPEPLLLQKGDTAEHMYILSSAAFACPHAFYAIPQLEALQHYELKHDSFIKRRVRKEFDISHLEIYNKKACPYITKNHWWNQFWDIGAEIDHEAEALHGVEDIHQKTLENTSAELKAREPGDTQENILILIDKFLKKPLKANDLNPLKEGLLSEINEGLDNLVTVLLVEGFLLMYRDNIDKVVKVADLNIKGGVKREIKNRIRILELECLFHELALLVYYCQWTKNMIEEVLKPVEPHDLVEEIFKTEKQIDRPTLLKFINEVEDGSEKLDSPEKLREFNLDAFDAEELYEALIIKKIYHTLIEEFENIANLKPRKARKEERFIVKEAGHLQREDIGIKIEKEIDNLLERSTGTPPEA